MKSGYRIHWTDNALEELAITIEYQKDSFIFSQTDSIKQKERVKYQIQELRLLA